MIKKAIEVISAEFTGPIQDSLISILMKGLHETNQKKIQELTEHWLDDFGKG